MEPAPGFRCLRAGRRRVEREEDIFIRCLAAIIIPPGGNAAQNPLSLKSRDDAPRLAFGETATARQCLHGGPRHAKFFAMIVCQLAQDGFLRDVDSFASRSFHQMLCVVTRNVAHFGCSPARRNASRSAFAMRVRPPALIRRSFPCESQADMVQGETLKSSAASLVVRRSPTTIPVISPVEPSCNKVPQRSQ